MNGACGFGSVRGSSSIRLSALLTASTVALCVACPATAVAQNAPAGTSATSAPPQAGDAPVSSPSTTPLQNPSEQVGESATPVGEAAAQDDESADIIVTGSNIVRNGFRAPTPTTVVGVEKLQEQPRPDIADTLNTLPAFRGSTQPQTGVANLNGGFGGVNALNLRGFGVQRTLTLLDGIRSVAATADGQVDVSQFPQELVERVDVVTGGASSAYGSDAVTGVVNFVLNKNFTGIKGELSGGITGQGDDENVLGSVSAGFKMFKDRGHLLLSAQGVYRDGILFPTNRDWLRRGWAVVQNPTYTATNGQPQFIAAENTNLSVQVPGGIITSGPLRGTTFNDDGSPRPFVYGPVVGLNNFMIGGEQNFNTVKVGTLDPRGDRQTFFGRFAYDVTDRINAFVQVQYARSTNTSGLTFPFNNGLTIRAQENPFVPATLAAQARALGVTTFPLGVTFLDLRQDDTLRQIGADNKRETQRYVIGATGDFTVGDGDWRWNASYQKGITNTNERIVNNVNTQRLTLAVDAVRVTSANVGTSGLTVGSVACRSTLANPANGCVPYNPFGRVGNGQGVVDYLIGTAERDQKLQLDNFKAGISGEPFSTWAGPVSFATGFEWRKEQVRGVVDPISSQNLWFTSNYVPAVGEYDVTEGFAETVIPLAKDQAWAQSLELNAAIRYTEYSNSGGATTWKIGGTYEPVEDIRFRATYSRDIRAPNLGELFGGSTSATPNTRDPFLNNITYAAPTFNRANPALVPEKAHTFGAGVVLQPSFIPGLSASVDYWSIKLDGGISTLGQQNIIDFCFASNNPALCGLITRAATPNPGEAVGRIQFVTNTPLNLAVLKRRGIDFEVGYRVPIQDWFGPSAGQIDLRAFATRYLEGTTDNGFVPAINSVGADPSKWVFNGSLSYSNGPGRMTLTAYGFDGGKWNNTYVECTTSCPASTTLNPTVNDNSRPGVVYLDFTSSVDIGTGWTAFINVQNLADKDPVQATNITNQPGGVPNIDPRWSTLGRTFRLGLRFTL